jgi:putative transcriptional regulator
MPPRLALALLVVIGAAGPALLAQSKNAKDLGPASVLVASRDLADPNFAKTVILLVHFDEDSVLGLIVNRHTDVPISRLFEGLKSAKDRADSIYFGGPVEISTVFALLESRDKLKGVDPVFGETYLLSSKALLEKTVAARPDPAVFHVFCGYAGWSNVQLQREVNLGMWFIFQADTKTVFDADPDSLWQRMIRKTEQTLAMQIKVK